MLFNMLIFSIVGWMVPPPQKKDIKVWFLEPVNIILYGNISADMIKVKNFEMRKLSWIIQVSPNCHHSVFIKERQREMRHIGIPQEIIWV